MRWLFPGKPVCPECNKNDMVYTMDRGVKLLSRMIIRNNRFACGRCKISWRRKDRCDTTDLIKKEY